MANDDYIKRLKKVIFHRHVSDSRHVESVPVHEMFCGQTVWKGVVEVFALTNHPKAEHCYAWSHGDEMADKGETFATMLGVPPVDSAHKAVQTAIIRRTTPRKT